MSLIPRSDCTRAFGGQTTFGITKSGTIFYSIYRGNILIVKSEANMVSEHRGMYVWVLGPSWVVIYYLITLAHPE